MVFLSPIFQIFRKGNRDCHYVFQIFQKGNHKGLPLHFPNFSGRATTRDCPYIFQIFQKGNHKGIAPTFSKFSKRATTKGLPLHFFAGLGLQPRPKRLKYLLMQETEFATGF